jgi:EmrB/QacA subfamily drug resistance transporter
VRTGDVRVDVPRQPVDRPIGRWPRAPRARTLEGMNGSAINEDNRRWWTLAAMCFALFMLMLDNTVVNVALPSIQRALGASLSSLEWTVNAYTLTFAVFLVTGGRLGDIFGRRRMFLIGVVVFTLSSAAIGAAPSDALLVAGRAIQGIGGALMMPATLSIVTNAFPPEERGRAIGTWAGVSALALAVGPVVGGALTEYVSWRAIFYLNVPVAAGAVAMTLYSTHESRDPTAGRRVDLPGVAALTVGLTALVLALVDGNRWGWGSPAIVSLLVVSAAALAAFVAIERRVVAPIVDFAVFRSRSFFGASLVGFIVTFAMFGMFFFLALYMQNVLALSPIETGLRFLPATITIMVAAPLAGRLTDRIGPRILVTCGMTIVAIALFLTTRIEVGSGYGRVLPALLLLGLGIGATMAPMSTAAMNAVSTAKAGVASGLLAMSRMVGGTFGVAALGALVQHLASNRLAGAPISAAQRDAIVHNLGAARGLPAPAARAAQDAFVNAFSSGMWLCAGVALTGALVAWALIDRHPAAVRYARASSGREALVPER